MARGRRLKNLPLTARDPGGWDQGPIPIRLKRPFLQDSMMLKLHGALDERQVATPER